MITIERIILAVAAVVAFLLQLFLAPHIAVGYATPNFIAVLCLVAAVVRAGKDGCVMAFSLGLLFDLISGNPVGALAFSLTAACAVTAWFFARANNDTMFMMLVTLTVGLFGFELLYGIIIMISGYAGNPLEMFAFHILPCYLYDLVLALIACLAVTRLLGGGSTVQPEITQIS